ncbi:hypothetical protein QVD99_005109 [Batrachochytrium dendrobatidis]|nr:hypothetical protein O5D80_004447 [Batrachochytrium dendrobatidis]KAK5668069.1 hypothetical protein QVD99_005109 [Batrachochytrium dendrobatidis]
MSGTNNVPLGVRKKREISTFDSDMSSNSHPVSCTSASQPIAYGAPAVVGYGAGSRVLPTVDHGERIGRPLKRRSRWGNDEAKVTIPGMPVAIPAGLTEEQIESYVIHVRLEDISRSLKVGDYVPSDKRSVSPPPEYGTDGRRINTREFRYRKKLEDERHKLVEKAIKVIPGFRPPADYKRPTKILDKIYIPVRDFPEINFIGLLIGPRGNTLKKIESESGAKISIRGKGSVKEGRGRNENAPQAGEEEDLHCVVSGDTDDKIRKGVEMINKIIETATSVPEGQNELKRNQLRELAALNGTLRDDENQICNNCGAVGHRRYECPEQRNFTANLICRICQGVGHIARDCTQRNNPAALEETSQRNQRLDSEYENLMAELGGNPSGSSAPNSSAVNGGDKAVSGRATWANAPQTAASNDNAPPWARASAQQSFVPPPAPTSGGVAPWQKATQATSPSGGSSAQNLPSAHALPASGANPSALSSRQPYSGGPYGSQRPHQQQSQHYYQSNGGAHYQPPPPPPSYGYSGPPGLGANSNVYGAPPPLSSASGTGSVPPPPSYDQYAGYGWPQQPVGGPPHPCKSLAVF